MQLIKKLTTPAVNTLASCSRSPHLSPNGGTSSSGHFDVMCAKLALGHWAFCHVTRRRSLLLIHKEVTLLHRTARTRFLIYLFSDLMI
jgi:hypothetical protein